MIAEPQSSDNRNAEHQRLVVFSDDWGRHPSSCQHLVGHLLDRHPTLWVNTIGTRSPKWSTEDFGKIATKLGQWAVKPNPHPFERNRPTVVNPMMYPGFRKRWQRRLNARLVAHAVNQALGPRHAKEQRVAVTTVPIVADVAARLRVDRWVYYCVDDFTVWPGLDGTVIDAMERQLVRNVDRIVAVSQTLQQRLASWGRDSVSLSHGIDLDHWTSNEPSGSHHRPPTLGTRGLINDWAQLKKPIVLFWGVVDQRLDTECCLALAQATGTLILAGPQQSPDRRLAVSGNIRMPGPVPYADLPALARAADVLVMPYADLPVTRAIQPLKLKEYLATGKPTVVRKLPATAPWSDAADVVETTRQFVQTVTQRATQGIPIDQQQARKRLQNESWTAKATFFEQVLFAP